jgi:ParB family transcriptional regulator, chromosome partitioning protein
LPRVASSTKRRAGIGRGLAAILPETSADAAAGELLELPVDLIKPNPNQPRTNFDPDALAALAASIEATGVVQPLLVRPLHDGSYELVAGERRWRASQQAGLEKVPAIAREQAEPERLQAALIENMVREDLNPVEEAKACAALVEDLKLTKEDLARRVGRSRSTISNLIRLLELPDEALEMLEKKELSEGHGRAILGAAGNDVRRRLAREAKAGDWSVRETEQRVRLAGQPKARPRKAPIDPDQRAALDDATDALESALGHEVSVKPRGSGIVAELRFENLDEAHALARELRRRGN